MLDLNFTRAHAQVLRDQAIGADAPGAVLRDFGMLLDYIGDEGVPAAGKHHLLPIEAIGILNPRLSRPLLLGEFKRPMLPSHPYLQGLHLLLRASGLGRIAGVGSKACLSLDGAARSRWNELNPTEKYFTLLEAWLLFGCPSMVGERASRARDMLSSCLQALGSLPRSGTQFDVSRPQDIYIHGCYGSWFNLGLLDLFGLMEVVHANTAVKPWRPAGLKHRPFGDGLLTLLAKWLFSADGSSFFRTTAEEPGLPRPRFGALQPLLQPYFPEWRANLELDPDEPRTGVFVFRIALGRMWRRLAVPAEATLDELVGWILDAVDFDNDHLHAFYARDRFGAELCIADARTEEGPWSDQVRVGELPLQPGETMTLVYDFGDNWRFNIKLERIEHRGTRIKTPALLEKQGAAPQQYSTW